MPGETKSGDEPALAELHDLLRRILQQALVQIDGTSPANPSLRALLVEACTMAHANGLRAEELLLMLKSAWGELSELRLATRTDPQTTLDQVVTLCIDQYFAD